MLFWGTEWLLRGMAEEKENIRARIEISVRRNYIAFVLAEVSVDHRRIPSPLFLHREARTNEKIHARKSLCGLENVPTMNL